MCVCARARVCVCVYARACCGQESQGSIRSAEEGNQRRGGGNAIRPLCRSLYSEESQKAGQPAIGDQESVKSGSNAGDDERYGHELVV